MFANTTWVRRKSWANVPTPRFSCWTTDKGAGANTLLAYFHYCNKGIYPFSTECKDQDLQSLAELDDEAINFVSSTRQFAAAHCECSIESGRLGFQA